MAADGDVLWEQVFGAAFFDAASQVLVNENQLVIGGGTHLPGDSVYPNFTEFLVAHDINAGGRLWSTTIGHDGRFSDFIGGLAIIGQNVFETWTHKDIYADFSDASFHRKHDLSTGSVIWERTVGNPASLHGAGVSSMAVVASRGEYFISGTAWPGTEYGSPYTDKVKRLLELTATAIFFGKPGRLLHPALAFRWRAEIASLWLSGSMILYLCALMT